MTADGQKRGGDEVLWISVYETVKGKKLRSLARELNCSINEALGLLVGFWLWGLKENTDLDGRIPDADRKYLARIIAESLDERYTGEQALEAMISTGWLDETFISMTGPLGSSSGIKLWTGERKTASGKRGTERDRHRKLIHRKKTRPKKPIPAILKPRTLPILHRRLQKRLQTIIRPDLRSSGVPIRKRLEKGKPTSAIRPG